MKNSALKNLVFLILIVFAFKSEPLYAEKSCFNFSDDSEAKAAYDRVWSDFSTPRGQFQCKVQSASVTRLIDGRAELYEGARDGFKKGDNLGISYAISADDCFRLIINNYDSEVKSIPTAFLADNVKRNIRRINFSYGEKTNRSAGYIFGDEIKVQDVIGDTKFYLKRYYKNDYEGMLVLSPNFTSDNLIGSVVTMDCRSDSGSLEKIFDYYKK